MPKISREIIHSTGGINRYIYYIYILFVPGNKLIVFTAYCVFFSRDVQRDKCVFAKKLQKHR